MDIPPPSPAVVVPPLPPADAAMPRRSRVPALVAGLVLIALVAAGAAYYFSTHSSGGTAALPEPSGPQYSYDQGDFDGGIAQIDALLKLDPSDAGLLTFKSVLLSQKGIVTYQEADYGAQALAVAQQAVASATTSESYFALGFANEVLGKYGDAHAAYQKAAELNPKNAKALTGDARVYELEGDATKAKTGYALSLVADPRAYNADIGLGRVKSAQGDLAGAHNSFDKAFDHSTNVHERAQASFGIGMLLAASGDFDGAEISFQSAQALEPAYPSAWLGLGLEQYARSVASSTPSGLRAGYARLSTESLQAAAARAGLAEGHIDTHPELSLDTALVISPKAAQAAFKAAEAAAADDVSIKDVADRKQIVDLLSGYAAFIAKGPLKLTP